MDVRRALLLLAFAFVLAAFFPSLFFGGRELRDRQGVQEEEVGAALARIDRRTDTPPAHVILRYDAVLDELEAGCREARLQVAIMGRRAATYLTATGSREITALAFLETVAEALDAGAPPVACGGLAARILTELAEGGEGP